MRTATFLVVLDVDSTLIEDEVIDLLAEVAGSLDEVSRITARAMDGELDFGESLVARVATLAGTPVTVFADVLERITVTEGVPELISAVHLAGGAIGVVSGGFHEVVDPLAEQLELDFWAANRLGVRDLRLTGAVDGPVIDAAAKASALSTWAAERGIRLERTIAIGDGANDLAMMAIAGLSIGFDAKAPVRGAADLVLDERDLSLVLPILGLTRH